MRSYTLLTHFTLAPGEESRESLARPAMLFRPEHLIIADVMPPRALARAWQIWTLLRAIIQNAFFFIPNIVSLLLGGPPRWEPLSRPYPDHRTVSYVEISGRNQFQVVPGAEVSAGIFSPSAIRTNLRMDIAAPGAIITVGVKNGHGFPAAFNIMLRGKTVE